MEINGKQIQKSDRFVIDDTEPWKLVCDELKEYYGKSLYWLPFKFSIHDIKREFLYLKKEGDTEFNHLMNRLYRENS